MLATEELLEPITPESACGVDLRYDASYQLLETALRGKPETQFSAAEEPAWPQILSTSLDLFQRSKDLRLGVILTLASLQTDGILGFKQGLALLHGLIDRYWEEVFPRLDPEEDNDPTERINVLSSMIAPVGTFEDPMRFLERLRKAPLCKSPRFGQFDLAAITGDGPLAEGQAHPTPAQVQAAMRDTDPALLGSTHAAVRESIQTVKVLSDAISNKVGAGAALDFAPLVAVLSQMEKAVAPYAGGAGSAESAPTQAHGAEEGMQHSGAIHSREDVVQALERICQYYQREEPSSPIPLLLRRAQRLAGKSFLEIMKDLSPDALGPIKLIAGEEPTTTEDH